MRVQRHMICLLLCLPALSTLAQQLDRRVSMEHQLQPLKVVLDELSAGYGVSFVYSSYFVPVDKKVTLSVREATIAEVLDQLLQGTRVAYEEVEGHVILKPVRKAPLLLTHIDGPARSLSELQTQQPEEEVVMALPERPVREKVSLPEPITSPIYRELPGGDHMLPNQVMAYMDEIIREKQAESEPQTPLHKIAQISLLPMVGTNLTESHKTTNHVSVNLLWGYNGGVEGVEVGGFINSIARDVKGVQVAGLGNTVGGQVAGTQVAGLFNVTGRAISGAQVSGLFNISGGEASQAVQASGLFNVSGPMTGIQTAAGFNVTNGNSEAIQVAGLFNIASGSSKAQTSLLFNRAEDIGWGQVSFLWNRARRVKGVQLSLINVADTVAGAPIGLLNFIRQGYNRVELSTGDAFFGNLGVKFGAHRFYNILHLGVRWDDKAGGETLNMSWGLGYGLGSAIFLSKKRRWLLNLEGVLIHVNERERWTRELNLLTQIRLTADVRIGRRVSFFAGPQFNIFASRRSEPETGEYHSDLPPYTLKQTTRNGVTTSMWLGFSGGLRF